MKRLNKILPWVLAMVLICAGAACASDGAGDGRKIWDLVWRIVNFVLLVGLLWYFLADKVKEFFVGRQEEIATSLDEVDKARTGAEDQYAEYERKLKNVEQDIQEIKDMLLGELENEKARIIEEGKASAERIVEQARWSAEQEIVKARKELQNQVADMAADMAAGVVSQNMTDDDQKRILDDYLDKVVKEQ